MMRIIIRLDDITPKMNMEKFYRMKAILDKYDVKPIIGVVPDCKDENLAYNPYNEQFWSLVEELQISGWTIAQHGTYHVYETDDAGLLGINAFSEFAGLPYENQYEKLKAGLDILKEHGIETDIFMAPGHTYDINTLKALKMLGFTTVTDGLYELPYTLEGIVCVPCRLAALTKVHGLDTICYHANLMDDTDFEELEKFIYEHKDNIISFDKTLFKKEALEWNPSIKKAELKVLKTRGLKDRIAHSKKMAWYLSYTNHNNSKIKLIKRIFFLPLLLRKMPND